MNWLDIASLAGGGVLALVGLWMGAAHIGVTVAGVLGGIVLASWFHDDVQPVFSRLVADDNVAQFSAFAFIFVLVLILAVVVGFMTSRLLKMFMLGWADRVMRLVFGMAVTFAVGSALFSAIQSYPFLGLEATIQESVLASFMADHFDTIMKGLKLIPGDLGA